MADVFISYARSTAKQALGAAAALRALGYSAWLDEDLPTHRAYARVIEEELSAARAVLVIWSADAAASDWVASEAGHARSAGKLVQLRIDGTRLPMPFDQIQCADLTGWPGQGEHPAWAKVVASVAELVGAAPRTVSASGATMAPSRGGRRTPPWAWAAAALAVLLVFAGGAWLALRHRPAPAAAVRVAVLPFDAAGGPDARAFADTLVDEIVGVLSSNQVETLSRADSQGLGGTDVGDRLQRLGVGLLLDGIVQSNGKTVSVRIHLDDARAHLTLWSKRFEAPLADAEALKAQVASRATDTTGGAIWLVRKSVDPAVIAEWLEASEPANVSPGRFLTLTRDIVAREPNFSEGHALLAWALLSAAPGLPAEAQARIPAEATREAEQALALDPTNGDPYTALSAVQPLSAWRKREDLLRRGLAARTSDGTANMLYCVLLAQTGRSRDAVAQGRLAVSTDPLSARERIELAAALAQADQTEEAVRIIADARRTSGKDPGLAIMDLRLAGSTPSRFLEKLDDPDVVAAFGAVGLAAAVPVWKTYAQALLSTDSARKKVASAALVEAIGKGMVAPVDAIWPLYALGDGDDAFGQADRVFSAANLRTPTAMSPADTTVLFGPLAAPMRRDPRFMSLAARLGLVDYWRSTGHWPDFCAESGLSYDCKAVAARLAAATPPKSGGIPAEGRRER